MKIKNYVYGDENMRELEAKSKEFNGIRISAIMFNLRGRLQSCEKQ